MKKFFLFTCLFSLICAAKCGQDIKTYELGEPIRLELGERAECQDKVMQFVSVKEDSRCPRYTDCVWAGQVVVQLSIGEDGREQIDLTLEEGKPNAASQNLGGYLYRLQEVNPYPEAGQNIKMEDYVITLLVEAI